MDESLCNSLWCNKGVTIYYIKNSHINYSKYQFHSLRPCGAYMSNWNRSSLNYIKQWEANMADLDRNPILRSYRYIKWSFKIEPYLYLVKDHRYRHAIAQLRTSSHILHIERGRYTKPRTPVNERLCTLCNCVEDELHFVTACTINQTERKIMYDKICLKFPNFSQLNDAEKFIFLFTFSDAQTLSWLGKYLYKSFLVRVSACSSE